MTVATAVKKNTAFKIPVRNTSEKNRASPLVSSRLHYNLVIETEKLKLKPIDVKNIYFFCGEQMVFPMIDMLRCG